MKKTILTEEIKKWNLYSKLVYLVPEVLFLLFSRGIIRT